MKLVHSIFFLSALSSLIPLCAMDAEMHQIATQLEALRTALQPLVDTTLPAVQTQLTALATVVDDTINPKSATAATNNINTQKRLDFLRNRKNPLPQTNQSTVIITPVASVTPINENNTVSLSTDVQVFDQSLQKQYAAAQDKQAFIDTVFNIFKTTQNEISEYEKKLTGQQFSTGSINAIEGANTILKNKISASLPALKLFLADDATQQITLSKDNKKQLTDFAQIYQQNLVKDDNEIIQHAIQYITDAQSRLSGISSNIMFWTNLTQGAPNSFKMIPETEIQKISHHSVDPKSYQAIELIKTMFNDWNSLKKQFEDAQQTELGNQGINAAEDTKNTINTIITTAQQLAAIVSQEELKITLENNFITPLNRFYWRKK